MTTNPIINNSKQEETKSAQFDKGEKERSGESLLKETYLPTVFLSLSFKTSTSKSNESESYRTMIIDQQLQYERLEDLEKRIEKQLTILEDEIIDELVEEERKKRNPGQKGQESQD